jgi:hypothetical protein
MRYFLCFLILSIVSLTWGQISLRSSVGLKKEITKKIDISGTLEYRLNPVPTSDKILLEVKLNYDLFNAIESFLAYRNGCEENDFSYINNRTNKFDNRIALGSNFSILDLFKIEKSRWKLNWTIQYQYTMRQFEYSRNVLRNKVLCKYDIKNSIFTPFVSSELFFGWNQHVLYDENTIDLVQVGSLSQWRNFAGIELELPKNQKFNFQVGSRWNYKKSNQDWIVKVGYFATLKKKKKINK